MTLQIFDFWCAVFEFLACVGVCILCLPILFLLFMFFVFIPFDLMRQIFCPAGSGRAENLAETRELLRQAQSQRQETPRPAPPSSSKGQILIIDDETQRILNRGYNRPPRGMDSVKPPPPPPAPPPPSHQPAK